MLQQPTLYLRQRRVITITTESSLVLSRAIMCAELENWELKAQEEG